jgi:hypothetical protein
MKIRAPFLVLVALSLPALSAGAQDVPAIRPVGPPIRISDAAQGAAVPDLAATPDGGYLVVWYNQRGGTGEDAQGVFARRYDAAGHPLGGEVLVAPVTFFADRPRVAVSSTGEAQVVWIEGLTGTLRSRRLAADGQPAGAVQDVVSPLDCCQSVPDVAFLRSGASVIVWQKSYFSDVEPIAFDTPIDGILLDASGQPQGEIFAVSPPLGAADPRVAAEPSGGFAVAWTVGPGGFGGLGFPVRIRRFTTDGTPAGPEIAVAGHGFSPVPLVDPDGTLSVVWATQGSNSFFEPTGIFAQPIGSQAVLDSPLELSKAPFLSMPMDATVDRQGNKLLVWAVPGTGGASQVLGRLFSAAWLPQGPAVPVGTLLPAPLLPGNVVLARPKGPSVAAGSSSFLTVWDGLPQPHGQFSQAAGQILGGSCFQDVGDLCLAGGRFRVDVAWRNVGTGATGTGTAVPLTDDTGSFWFFNAANLELLVKVLDGRGVNGHWWVFFGALTDVEYDLTVTDLQSGNHKTWHNPAGTQASGADTAAF